MAKRAARRPTEGSAPDTDSGPDPNFDPSLDASFDYEASAERLAAIVRRLEAGQVPLAESLRLFDEGQGLLRRCQLWLDRARLRVSEATAGPDGQVAERPLD